MTTNNKKPELQAFVVTGSKDKPFFTNIGAAWKNTKGGFKIKLNAFPVNGEILLMKPKGKEEQ